MQKDDAVAVHEVHDAWIGCPQAPTQGLQQLVDEVDIDGVDYAHAYEQRLVQGVPIDAEQRKRGVYALVRAEAIEQQVVHGVVVLVEELLLDGVLLQDFHLQQAHDVLDGHGVERRELAVSVMDDEVVVHPIRAGYAHSECLNGLRLVRGAEPLVVEEFRIEVGVRLVGLGLAPVKRIAGEFGECLLGAGAAVAHGIEVCDLCMQGVFERAQDIGY